MDVPQEIFRLSESASVAFARKAWVLRLGSRLVETHGTRVCVCVHVCVCVCVCVCVHLSNIIKVNISN